MVGRNSVEWRGWACAVLAAAVFTAARLPMMGMAKVNYSRYKVFRIRPESERREWLTEKLETIGES